MIEQGHNYLGGPIHSTAEFCETRIENLEKSIPPSVPLRNNKKRKNPKKRKNTFLDDSEDEDLDKETVGKRFYKYHALCGHTTDECTTYKALIRQAKQNKGKHFKKKKSKQEVNAMVEEKVKKALKRKKRKHTDELCAFEKMSFSFEQESIGISSSEEGEI